MKYIIYFLIFLIFSLFYGQANKYYQSKELKYERFFKESDFWINSPLILDNSILFFYKGKAKKVVLAAEFNNWKPEFAFTFNPTNNIWLLYYDKRLKKGKYKYRLVVDDIWINDPNNTNILIDDAGQKITYFELEEDFIPYAKYPLEIEDGIYIFKYKNEKVKNVNIAGTFNNWNPYSHPMEYIGEGEFIIKIKLNPGLHSYCFIADGEWVADPYNLNQFRDQVGNIVSIIFVKTNKIK